MRKFLKFILILILIIAFALVCCSIYGYFYYQELTKRTPLKDKIDEIKSEYTYVKIGEVPEDYKNAVVAVEDRRYYSHGPVDYIGLARALVINIKSQELQQGGSTITQQVAKNLYLIEDKDSDNVRKKFCELFLARELEKEYSKDEILEIYMNIIYFGNGYYGIKEACNGYLKKNPIDMNLAESTMMAGIPNAPSVYAPTVNKELCKNRQKKVISSMIDARYISKEEAEKVDNDFIDKIN